MNSEGLQSTKPDAVQSGEKEWIQSSDGSGSSSSFLSQSSVESNAEQEPGERSKGVVFTSLSHVNDLSTYMIQNVINYAKVITDFRSCTDPYR